MSTIQARHVRIRAGRAHVRYEAKGGIERAVTFDDPATVAALEQLRRHRKGSDRLLAFHDRDGWHDVHAADLNGYLKAASGVEMTAKDLRTWRATVLAAGYLAAHLLR